MRKNYLIQPYLVGNKNAKSLAVVIPSDVVKKYHIDKSTGFILDYDDSGIQLQYMDLSKRIIPVDQSLATRDQQVSIVKGVD